MQKKSLISLSIFILSLIVLFGVFLYIRIKPYDYTREYQVNGFKITEKYDKKSKIYTYLILKDQVLYPYQIKSKYISHKELIDDIEEYNGENEICILPISKNISFYPLCSKDKAVYSYNISNTKIDNFKYPTIESDSAQYERLILHNLINKKYLVYNYKGFYYLSDKEMKNIKLFSNDKYTLDLIYQYNDILVVPDYNQEYYFTKIYLIDLKNGKVKELNFDYEISFNSRFLGGYKNYVYLLDNKEKKEYAIDIKKNKIKNIDFKILENNKLIVTTYENINNNNLIFPVTQNFNYQIIDNALYQVINDNLILISTQNVQKIIQVNDDTVYYIDNENLYGYNGYQGEFLILTDIELNFNNTNMVFISK